MKIRKTNIEIFRTRNTRIFHNLGFGDIDWMDILDVTLKIQRILNELQRLRKVTRFY